MGFTFTKYETSTDIVFDTSKFDCSYDADTFPTDAATDFDNILLEHGDIYYITRQTTEEDSMGHVTDVSSSSFRVYGIIQDITIKDRKVHDMGLAVPGNRKFYFKPTYMITSAGVEINNEVKEGDILTDSKLYTGKGDTGQFRVVKILRQWYEPSEEIFRTAIVQNINLDGTE